MVLIQTRNICIYLFVVSFFFFPRLQTIFIGLAFSTTFFTGDFRNFPSSVLRNKTGLAIALYFLITLLSMLYTEDVRQGWRGIEIKFSMIAFPLFLPLIFYNRFRTNWSRVLKVVVITAIAYALLSFGRSCYLYLLTEKSTHLFSSNLGFRLFQDTPFVHPTYLSIYYVILILIIGDSVISSKNNLLSKSSLLKIGILLFFVVFIFFLSSKVGLILVLLAGIALIVQYAIKKQKKLQALVVIVVFAVLAGVGINNSKLKVRFEQAFQDMAMSYDKPGDKVRSTSARIWVWKSTVLVIEGNPILGVGIGDFRNEIIEKYKEVGITDEAILKLDSHQQYLQTTATLGMLGLFSLLLIFISLFYYSFKYRSFVLFCFAITYLIFGFTESMFETQAGIIFFTFFSVILVTNLRLKYTSEDDYS